MHYATLLLIADVRQEELLREAAHNQLVEEALEANKENHRTADISLRVSKLAELIAWSIALPGRWAIRRA